MEKRLIDRERIEDDFGIVNENPVDEIDLDEQEVVAWEKLMTK